MHFMETLIEIFGPQISIKKEVEDKLRDLQAQKKALDEQIKSLTNEIIEQIKPHSNEGIRVGEFNYIVKGNNYSLEFDLEGFKNDYPYLYIEYLVPKYNAPSFLLAKATREKKQ